MAYDQQSRISSMVPTLHAPSTADGGTSPRFIVAVDFGTTYTGVAWVLTTGEHHNVEDIHVVDNWGGNNNERKVPSKFTYSANDGTNWGYNIGHNAYVIQWTKLQLEPPSTLDALDALKRTLVEATKLAFTREHVLRSEIPRHLIRTSVDVVTDFLTEVAECVVSHIENERDRDTLNLFPIDFVITHPAVWHSRAVNQTFRAVNAAFEEALRSKDVKIGSVRLATEPEACAQYTMRSASENHSIRLKQGDCFIVVDAGGGTVDLVAYRVDEVEPFRVTRVTDPSGDYYGATCVDQSFLKDFLLRRLGPQKYHLLMGDARHGQGAHTVLRQNEEDMLARFMDIKHDFAGKPDRGEDPLPFPLTLPPIGGIPDDDPDVGIHNGALHITHDDMEEMFRYSVEGIISLINEQLIQVDRQDLKAKTIFMSGGFSRNEYLYKRVGKVARHWRCKLIRGDDSWTAVAKGAVLMGLGQGCITPKAVTKCPFHIGVVVSKRYNKYEHDSEQKYTDSFDNSYQRARDHIHWLVAKGDIVTADEGISKTLRLVRRMSPVGAKRGEVKVITSTSDRRRGPPTKYNPQTPDPILQEVVLEYDLESSGGAQYPHVASPSGRECQQVDLQLQVTVRQNMAQAALVLEGSQDSAGIFATSTRMLPFPPEAMAPVDEN